MGLMKEGSKTKRGSCLLQGKVDEVMYVRTLRKRALDEIDA